MSHGGRAGGRQYDPRRNRFRLYDRPLAHDLLWCVAAAGAVGGTAT